MEQLKTAILRKINRTMESPKDFEYLSEQQQQILLDSLQTDKRNLELKNRADSLKIDSLNNRIATLQSDMSTLQNQTYQLENSIFMNGNNLYPHRYSSDNPNSQR